MIGCSIARLDSADATGARRLRCVRANSIKECVLSAARRTLRLQARPQTDRIDRRRAADDGTDHRGARPCDAALGPILDRVFNWDYVDSQYNRRRELTTVVTLACRTHDRHCFCTSVGSGPDDPRGSDVMLHALDEGILEIRCLTEKGRRLFEAARLPSPSGREAGGESGSPGGSCETVGQGQARLTAALSRKESGTCNPPSHFDLDKVQAFLADGFDDARWPEFARRCLGCGACAYTCPTCHCFDIVDEGSRAGGVRARNWDACQFVHVHAPCLGPQSPQPAGPAAAAADLPQVPHLSREVRRGALHRLRQLHAELPRRPGRAPVLSEISRVGQDCAASAGPPSSVS